MELLAEHIVDTMLKDIILWDDTKQEELKSKKILFKVAYRYTKEYITLYNIKVDIVKLTHKVVRVYKELES